MRFLLYFMAVAMLSVLTSCVAEKEREREPKTEERVRPASSGGTSAAYFSYSNTLDEPDTLISVRSPIASLTQVHESYETEEGMMGMREQREVAIPAGESLIFKQGGLHVMMMNVRKDLSTGDSVTVELEFKLAGKISKILPVKP